jgi:hypothetical protein
VQNLKPTPFSAVADHPSQVSDVLDRVIAITPAPLLPGEKQADYVDVALRIVRGARPRDAIEEFLVRDVVDLTWEILRLRRIKPGMLRASMSAGVGKVLDAVGYPYLQRNTLSENWAAGDEGARKKVGAILAKAELTIEEVTAKTLEMKIDVFEQIDRILASTEARRNNALREIDRHRETAGAAARKAIDDVEEVEFRDIETGQVSGGPAA